MLSTVGGMLQRTMGGGSGAAGDHGASSRHPEPTDTFCDLITRMQLLVLLEADAAEIAARFDGFDAGRQLQELLLCAACWNQKPTMVDDAGGASIPSPAPSPI